MSGYYGDTMAVANAEEPKNAPGWTLSDMLKELNNTQCETQAILDSMIDYFVGASGRIVAKDDSSKNPSGALDIVQILHKRQVYILDKAANLRKYLGEALVQ